MPLPNIRILKMGISDPTTELQRALKTLSTEFSKLAYHNKSKIFPHKRIS